MTQLPLVAHPAFTGRIGVGRRDITPPVGIYCRMWGSATHDAAEGIHRPLTATAIALDTRATNSAPLVLVAIDGTWWRTEEDEWFIRGAVLEKFSLDPARLMINLSHTHAGPSTSFSAADKPGGDKIAPYMHAMRDGVIQAIDQALRSAIPANLAWATGRCDLARDRQLTDPGSGRVVIGHNPDQPADDTVLVGRVTDSSGRIVATLVNYACHPTTLGGANRLISPDYIGAMRQVVEESTGSAPCMYLHGAAGELAPRRQYVGDPAVADSNGRQLGHAATAALHGMLPPGQALAYGGVERSGTDLGRWDPVAGQASEVLAAMQLAIDLPLKQLPTTEALKAQLAACKDRVLAERLERAVMLSTRLGGRKSLSLPVWLWQVGDAIVLGTPAEAHSPLQVELRRRFPDRAIVVMNIVNGYASYLPPRREYATQSYQAQIALFEEGCLEETIEACDAAVRQLIESPSPAGAAAGVR